MFEKSISVEEEISYNFGKVLRKSKDREISYSADALEEMIEKQWILDFGRGQWVFTQKMTSLMRTLKSMIREEVARKLDYREWCFPRLLKEDILEKFATAIYTPELLFKSESFVKRDSLPDTTYMLDPVQCAPLYASLAMNRDAIQFPMKIFECEGGWTYRSEDEVEGMIRCIDFMRTELVYIGSHDQVLTCRRALIDAVSEFIDLLELNWRITVGEPCFRIPKALELYADAKEFDDYPVLDFEGYIPHQDKWVEFSGCSNERARLLKAFGLPSENYWSGCVGIGLNRLAYIFVANHGLETDQWPQAVRDLMD